MAERLTKKIVKTVQDKYSLGNYLYYDFAEIDDTNKLLNKLGKLEDILEKYGIEGVEELEKEMHSLMLIISILSDYGIEDYNELDEILKEFSYMKKMETEIGKELKFYKTDRDTWKRACELTCKHIAEVEWLSCPETDNISESENEIKTLTKQSLNFFYQQAKKEGNDE